MKELISILRYVQSETQEFPVGRFQPIRTSRVKSYRAASFITKLGSTNLYTFLSFNHTGDTIQFDDAIFFTTLDTSATSGEFYAAAGATKAHDADDRIVYDTTTHKLCFDDDALARPLSGPRDRSRPLRVAIGEFCI